MNVLDILFPPLCYSCLSHLKKNERELNVCESCAAKIQVHSSLFCPVCKSRIPIRNYKLSESTNTVFVNSGHSGFWVGLPACHPDAPFLLAACSDYGNPAVRELLHTFKYKKIENAIHPLTELLIKPYIQGVFRNWELSARGGSAFGGEIRNFLIVPIPLHPSKKRSRGFNQSELIAKYLETELLNLNPQTLENWKLKIENSALKRVRQTDPQAETKNTAEREENVRDCFEVVENWKFPPEADPPRAEKIGNSSTIVLVDDVYTSGATMEEAVRALKDAGAKRIIAFVLAKA